MPTLFKNDFQGQTSGGDVTVENSGTSGDPFTHVLKPDGADTIKYLTAGGKTGVRFTPGGGGPSTRWTLSASQGRRLVTRRRFNYTGVLTQNRTLHAHHSSPFGAPAVTIGFPQQRSGQAQIEATFGNGTPITASRVTLPAAGTYEVEYATVSASASGVSDGIVAMRVYMADGVTLVDSNVQQVFTGLAMTNLHPGSVRWSTATNAGGFTFDDLFEPQALFTDDLTAWVGQYQANRTLAPVTGVTRTGVAPPTTVSPGNDGTISVTWNPLVDPDLGGYDIAIADGENASSGFVTVGTVAVGTHAYTVTGLEPGPYTVVVRPIPA